MTPDDRLLDDHVVGDVKECSASEERRVEGGETVAVGVNKREEPRLKEIRVLGGGDDQWLQDHAVRQRTFTLEPRAVTVRWRRQVRKVDAAHVSPAPLLIGLARHRKPFVIGKGAFAATAQPVGFALDLLQGFCCQSQSYPTEPSISSWMSRLSSTAYSSGSSFVKGSMNPLTIIVSASLRVMPRLIK